MLRNEQEETLRKVHDYGEKVRGVLDELVGEQPYFGLYQVGINSDSLDGQYTALRCALLAALQIAKELNVEERFGAPIGERMPYARPAK